jgi:hypothetical protein
VITALGAIGIAGLLARSQWARLDIPVVSGSAINSTPSAASVVSPSTSPEQRRAAVPPSPAPTGPPLDIELPPRVTPVAADVAALAGSAPPLPSRGSTEPASPSAPLTASHQSVHARSATPNEPIRPGRMIASKPEPAGPTPPTLARSDARIPPSTGAPSVPAMAASPSPASADERPPDIERTPPPSATVDAKFLTTVDAKVREFDAQLAWDKRALTVTASNDAGTPLQTVRYDTVAAVSYSVSRDPLWQSDDGAAAVLRRGGVLRKFGVSNSRHWIVLRTKSDQFVVFQLNETTTPTVLSLLEEHTGLRPQLVTESGRRPKD